MAPAVAISSIDPIDDLIRRSFAEERFRTVLISLFASMACALAAVGMFGVTSRAVSGRAREIGIRVALGATGGSVVRLIARGTLTGVVMGMVVGLLGSLAAARLLAPFLFGVTVHDAFTYAFTITLLAVVSLIASWLPARRVTRVQPALVLRGE